MKATIESTSAFVVTSDGAEARVWEGVTEGGIAFVAYISLVQVRRDADNSEFARELREHKQPSAATMHAIDLRLVL